MKLNFIGDITEVSEGLAILAPDYGFEVCEAGLTTKVCKGDGLAVSYNGKEASITYNKRCEFFRALGLLLEKTADGESSFDIKEKAFFDTCGGMVDLSHGALMNVDAIKSCLRKMAMMGLNMFLLYREESYHVPEYEYFGYMHGRHTDAQIKEIDDYAYALGIEIIPAIQCLGHLASVLQWGQFAEIKDTRDCLLVGEEKTYEFIECMLKAAMRPLRTKRVHIGFDETMSLGTGAYRAKHGMVAREDIFCEHLKRVADICRRLGYQHAVDTVHGLFSKGLEIYSVASDACILTFVFRKDLLGASFKILDIDLIVTSVPKPRKAPYNSDVTRMRILYYLVCVGRSEIVPYDYLVHFKLHHIVEISAIVVYNVPPRPKTSVLY